MADILLYYVDDDKNLPITEHQSNSNTNDKKSQINKQKDVNNVFESMSLDYWKIKVKWIDAVAAYISKLKPNDT
jgi:hypothetical protein